MSDIFDNPAAFAPFYDTHVAVRGVRPDGRTIRGTCPACVLDGGYDDVFDDDGGTGSRIRRIVVHIPKKEWADSRFPPQVGDEITIEHGVTFAVSSVDVLVADEYVVEARQK